MRSSQGASLRGYRHLSISIESHYRLCIDTLTPQSRTATRFGIPCQCAAVRYAMYKILHKQSVRWRVLGGPSRKFSTGLRLRRAADEISVFVNGSYIWTLPDIRYGIYVFLSP
ncbi:MAG TPA: hypothetical protein VIK63_06350 [Haloplasmataceae bacterium]